MAWNGAGTFVRLYNWVARAAVPATKYIDATSMDAEFDNFKGGLENCLTKTGETTPSANQAMATYRHTGVGAATARTDYARVAEVQDGTIIRAASTGGSINAMTGTITPAITSYATGMIFSIIAPGTGSNSSTTPTINLNTIGDKTIRKRQGALVAGDYTAGDTLLFMYDGTYAELLNPKYPVLNNPHSLFTTDSTGGAIADFIPFIDASEANADNKVLVSDFLKNVFEAVPADSTGGAVGDSLLFYDLSESGVINSMSITNMFTNALSTTTAKSAPILADTFMIADSAASGAPKVSTLQQAFNAQSLTTAKTTLATGDKLQMNDSAASDVAKHITWNNLKTQLITDIKSAASDQESGSSDVKFVTPLFQHRHQSAAKVWSQSIVVATVPDSPGTASYNMTSVADTATGRATFTIATDFSTANWCCLISAEEKADASENILAIATGTQAAGSVELNFQSETGAFNDPGAWHIAGFGDQS